MSISNISFSGSESTGSIGKRANASNVRYESIPNDQLEQDTVSFRGANYEGEEKKSSLLTKIFGAAVFSALAIGGLGYAHKADLVGKLKDGKFKDFMRKSDCVTEKCHEWCSKVKEFFTRKKS